RLPGRSPISTFRSLSSGGAPWTIRVFWQRNRPRTSRRCSEPERRSLASIPEPGHDGCDGLIVQRAVGRVVLGGHLGLLEVRPRSLLMLQHVVGVLWEAKLDVRPAGRGALEWLPVGMPVDL